MAPCLGGCAFDHQNQISFSLDHLELIESRSLKAVTISRCRVVFPFAYGKRRDHVGLEPRREKRERINSAKINYYNSYKPGSYNRLAGKGPDTGILTHTHTVTRESLCRKHAGCPRSRGNESQTLQCSTIFDGGEESLVPVRQHFVLVPEM